MSLRLLFSYRGVRPCHVMGKAIILRSLGLPCNWQFCCSIIEEWIMLWQQPLWSSFWFRVFQLWTCTMSTPLLLWWQITFGNEGSEFVFMLLLFISCICMSSTVNSDDTRGGPMIGLSWLVLENTICHLCLLVMWHYCVQPLLVTSTSNCLLFVSPKSFNEQKLLGWEEWTGSFLGVYNMGHGTKQNCTWPLLGPYNVYMTNSKIHWTVVHAHCM